VKQAIKNKVTGAIESVSVCSSWSGSHLSSQGCIQYGVLETEAAFDMPASGGAIAFFGTYMYGGENPGNVAIGTTAATQIVDPQVRLRRFPAFDTPKHSRTPCRSRSGTRLILRSGVTLLEHDDVKKRD
jgi:hypothetical protein